MKKPVKPQKPVEPTQPETIQKFEFVVLHPLNLVPKSECAPLWYELEYNEELEELWSEDRLEEFWDENGHYAFYDSADVNLTKLMAACKQAGCKDLSTIELHVYDVSFPGDGDCTMGMSVSFHEPLSQQEIDSNQKAYEKALTKFKKDKASYKDRLADYKEKNAEYKVWKKKEKLKKELEALG